MSAIGKLAHQILPEIPTTASVFLLTFIAIRLLLTYGRKKIKNLPPGPRGVPILGYLPFFGKEPPVTFANMRKLYGDVVMIYMGSWPTIVISGYETIKEAFVRKGDAFSGRPAFTTAKLANEGRNLGFSYGVVWKHHRRIVCNVMFAFSNARNNPIEDIIRSEAKIVIDEMLVHQGKSFCPYDILQVASSSMVYQLCYGRHANVREDKEFLANLTHVDEFQKFSGSGNPVDVIPWLRFIMPWKVKRFKDLLDRTVELRMRMVDVHEATFDQHHLRDIADGLIDAGNTLSEADVALGLDKQRIVESLDAIMSAGSVTIATILKWLVLLMAAHPQIQEDVFSEINEVVGQNREPTLSDRKHLPYTEATILETYRFAAPVPFSLPHAATRNTTLNGYDIQEGTVVLANLYSVLYDEDIWGDPQNFRPERFLDSDGHLNRVMADQVIAFSLGRRRCAGEFLARMEVFLFFVTLMQRSLFARPLGDPEYALAGHFTMSHEPDPFQVCVSQRD